METQDYLIAAAAFFLAAGIGFAGHQILFQQNQEFSTDLNLRVDSDVQKASTEFDGHYLELRYEDTPEAKFYFKFNDTRDIQKLSGLKHDGSLQTTMRIRSFGNQTYFLYLRYRDNPNQSGDGYMELYRIEET